MPVVNSGTWGPHNIKTDDLAKALRDAAEIDLQTCQAQNEHDICEFCQDGLMKEAAADCIEALADSVDRLGEKVAPIQGWVDALPVDADGVKQVSRGASGILTAQVIYHFPRTRAVV